MFKLLEKGLPVASSCKGDGVCGKCRITVLEGLENISSETTIEITLKTKNKLKDNERISCQLKVKGAIKIDTNYW
ncbi:MAG: (2Fe-2S)-binding protein [Bdellovibrionaceae bacterium]|nr:(2Fe-2S)-binding protein [Pseudobdellovibrionaceae bacterium]